MRSTKTSSAREDGERVVGRGRGREEEEHHEERWRQKQARRLANLVEVVELIAGRSLFHARTLSVLQEDSFACVLERVCGRHRDRRESNRRTLIFNETSAW